LRKNGAVAQISELARGGLAYLHANNISHSPSLGSLDLLDDAFVAGYAAHSIREKLGESARYSPPELSAAERQKAEELFLKLLDEPAAVEQTCVAVEKIVARLGFLHLSGFFRRFSGNVQFLIRVVRSSDQSDEHRRIAAAALAYIALESDLI